MRGFTGGGPELIGRAKDILRRLAGALPLLVVLASLGLAPAAQALSQAAGLHTARTAAAAPHSEPAHHPAPAVQDGDHCHPGIDCIGQTPALRAASVAPPAPLAKPPFRLRPRRLGGIAPGTDPPVPRD